INGRADLGRSLWICVPSRLSHRSLLQSRGSRRDHRAHSGRSRADGESNPASLVPAAAGFGTRLLSGRASPFTVAAPARLAHQPPVRSPSADSRLRSRSPRRLVVHAFLVQRRESWLLADHGGEARVTPL